MKKKNTPTDDNDNDNDKKKKKRFKKTMSAKVSEVPHDANSGHLVTHATK